MSARMTIAAILLTSFVTGPTIAAPPAPTRDEVHAGLQRAVKFFREQVSTAGGYLWQYSADLDLREGEGVATDTQVWIQSPGTPRVGQAYLDAYHWTGESYLWDVARDAALALVRGQLKSGGWDYRIEFDEQRRGRYAYRLAREETDGRNVTTLDDDNTQSALRFLMQMDRESQFQDRAIHECVEYALEHLLAAQYPNGAWPQRYSQIPDSAEYPVLRASYPKTWSRTFEKPSYMSFYTLNDNTLADMIRTMLEAGHVYGNSRFQQAAEKAGDFIIMAQMPDPQPAWAQQYDQQMHPAWARKFEPPAVTGGESQGVMRILMELYRVTGKSKYLQPIPRALDYLRRSTLPAEQLARFYELNTNRPLYFTKQYQLTYDSDDMPTHYAFLVGSQLESIQRRYDALSGATWKPPIDRLAPTQPVRDKRRAGQVRSLLESLDSRGAWVESGQLKYQDGPADNRIIRCTTFVNNITLLSEYMGHP